MLSGLNGYSSGDCSSGGCDASVDRTVPADAAKDTSGDGSVDTGVPPGPDGADAADDTYAADAEDATVDADGGALPEAGGCEAGLLACDGRCVDPSSAGSCGSCDNVCDAACAPVNGAFSCVASCPASTPTLCNGVCVDTTSNAGNCKTCGNACTTIITGGQPVCLASACTFICPTGWTYCNGACVDFRSDSKNCGGCGSTYACASGKACVNAACVTEAPDAGPDAAPDAAPDSGFDAGDGGSICGATGCPVSAATITCRVGGCNAAGGACASAGSGCYCTSDSQCKSNKCVPVAGQNGVSCGSSCTGTGTADAFDCALASPGIPPITPPPAATCPAGSGYHGTTLTCDSTHTSCYCGADNQCPSGKCIPSATNNNSCAGSTCTGSGTADYRGCQTVSAIPTCLLYVGCPASTTCSYPNCYCINDAVCDTGHCIPSSNNGNCSNCTGTGTDDGHGCEAAPSSVPCTAGVAACTTTLSPAPVPNPAKTACVCVADSDCASGKCVNATTQCTGTCTGTGPADSANCASVTSAATSWACPTGNCSTVTSATGKCAAAGVTCWCTNDSQCGGGKCAAWAGCATGACTGAGVIDGFHCVP